MAPKAGVLGVPNPPNVDVAPNAGVLVAPKAGVELTPNVGVVVDDPNAGCTTPHERTYNQ